MTEEPEARHLQTADLRLRGDPPRVMRLSRKTLAIGGLAVTAGIGGALIYALQPTAPKAPSELYATDTRATSDSLAGAPKDYSQVPRLGPPMPGDLGRPILSAQKRGVEVQPPPIGQAAPPPSRGPTPAQVAREHIRQERDEARISKVFIGSARDTQVVAMPSPGDQFQRGASATPVATAPPAGTSDQAGKREFLKPGQTTPTESANRLAAASSPNIVQAGSVIPAALITSIRSDLPGTITAQVTQNVYDSVTGRHLLIPQGSRLIGEYDSQISFGQNRVLLAWDRLILPDGRSIQLDRLPGADSSGQSGLRDRADQHWGGLLRTALISTLLSIDRKSVV